MQVEIAVRTRGTDDSATLTFDVLPDSETIDDLKRKLTTAVYTTGDGHRLQVDELRHQVDRATGTVRYTVTYLPGSYAQACIWWKNFAADAQPQPVEHQRSAGPASVVRLMASGHTRRLASLLAG